MKKRVQKISRFWKWLFGTVLTLVILTFAVSFYLSARWNPLVKNQLQQIVIQATDSLYALEYDDLDINLLSGNATLKNIKLVADTTLYAQKISQKSAEDFVYNMEIGKLKIRGVQIRRLLSDKTLKIKAISVDHSNIILNKYHHNFNDSIPSKDKKPLYQVIASSLKNVEVEKLDLSSVNFSLINVLDSVHQSATELKNIRIHVEDIFIDSTAHYDPSRFFYTKSIDMALPGFQYKLPDSIHYVAFDSILYHSNHENLIIKNLKFEPSLSRNDFYQKMGVAKEMIKLEFTEVSFEKLNANAFLESKVLSAKALKINKGKLDISNDLRYPRIKSSKIGQAPHQKLLKLNQKIKIDSVLIQGVDISYAEIGEKLHKEGKITFNQASGTLYNVTNDSLTLGQNKWLQADLKALLMNTGDLHVSFKFDMLSKNGAYSSNGRLGPMKGRVLNKIITPLLNAEVESADIRGLKFELQGTDYKNWGELNFDYDNLKINLLQTDSDGEKSKKGLISFVANQFIVNNSNPDAKGNYLISHFNYRRPPEYSFFKTLWKSLLEGIKYSVGVNHEKEKKLTNVVNFFKNSFGNQHKSKDKEPKK